MVKDFGSSGRRYDWSRSMPSSKPPTSLIPEHLMAITCFLGGASIEHAVKRWSVLMFRVVPLISLASHLILAAFSDIRRHKDWDFRRILVWVAYQLTDWAPAYVIGNLYIDTSPHEKTMVAFWVPFLLLHSARPDNISAYSLEDSGLSLRIAIVVPFQTFGSMYLIYRYIFLDCTTGLLLPASCIMLCLGIFKYVESAVALWRADLSYIWRTFKQRQKHPSSPPYDYGDDRTVEVNDEETLLLVAHDLFDVCKGAFSDFPVNLGRHETGISLFSGQWEIMYKVVEMELSLMYDILYTKAAMVHTWPGYAIRVASPLLVATALLLFGLQQKKGKEPADTIISYILLCTTLLLDMTWLFKALASSWMHSFFQVRPHSWLKHEIWCQGRWTKIRRIVISLRLSRLSMWLTTFKCPSKEPKSYRRWQGKFQGHNMLDECTRSGSDTLYSRFGLLKKIGWEDQSSGLEIPEYVRELVFKHVCTWFFIPDIQFVEDEEIIIEDELVDIIEDDSLGLPDHRMKNLVGMRLAPVDREQNVQAAQSMPIPYEQVDHWSLGQASFVYGQALPELYEQQTDHQRYDPASPAVYEMEEVNMIFPPKFQEVILIWHIATDLLLYSVWITPKRVIKEYGQPSSQKNKEYVKAIQGLSNYMMFLVTANSDMLPGRKFHTLYKTTLGFLRTLAREYNLDSYIAKRKLASWMLEHADHPESFLNNNHLHHSVWVGSQLAQMLLRSLSNDAEKRRTTFEIEDMVERLKQWIPDLQKPPGDIDGMLKFILDAWVRLLVFASIRCSRDSHAKRLSYGGELTTLVWIITEHTKNSVMKDNLKALFLH